MAKMNPRAQARQKRKRRIRKNVSGTSDRPRLTVFRSGRHIYAQLIDDVSGQTLASAGTVQAALKEEGKHLCNIEGAKKVGKAVAEAARNAGIESVVFDRNGYLYHGRVKALADAAREAGLVF